MANDCKLDIAIGKESIILEDLKIRIKPQLWLFLSKSSASLSPQWQTIEVIGEGKPEMAGINSTISCLEEIKAFSAEKPTVRHCSLFIKIWIEFGPVALSCFYMIVNTLKPNLGIPVSEDCVSVVLACVFHNMHAKPVRWYSLLNAFVRSSKQLRQLETLDLSYRLTIKRG